MGSRTKLMSASKEQPFFEMIVNGKSLTVTKDRREIHYGGKKVCQVNDEDGLFLPIIPATFRIEAKEPGKKPEVIEDHPILVCRDNHDILYQSVDGEKWFFFPPFRV